jgi:hypothetical protein
VDDGWPSTLAYITTMKIEEKRKSTHCYGVVSSFAPLYPKRKRNKGVGTGLLRESCTLADSATLIILFKNKYKKSKNFPFDGK